MPAATKSVLILEDELLIAMELQAIVEDLGCEVVGPVATCDAALELLALGPVDAAILDLSLADESCDRVADELTKIAVPWAIATGFDAIDVSERFQSVPIVAKPYGPDEVRALLAELLRQ